MKRGFVFDDGKSKKFVVQKEFSKIAIYEKGFISDTFIGKVAKEEQIIPFLEGKYGRIKIEFGKILRVGISSPFFKKQKNFLIL